MVRFFSKLFEDWLSNRDSWFLLKVQIAILRLPPQCLHLYSQKQADALWLFSKQIKHKLLPLHIYLRAAGLDTFKHLIDLWLRNSQKTHGFLSVLFSELVNAAIDQSYSHYLFLSKGFSSKEVSTKRDCSLLSTSFFKIPWHII